MTLTIIRWRDAMSVEAAQLEPPAAIPELAEILTTGWLIAENDEAVLLGMELDQDNGVHPGRWRFNIPKSGIVQRRDFEIGPEFQVRRQRS